MFVKTPVSYIYNIICCLKYNTRFLFLSAGTKLYQSMTNAHGTSPYLGVFCFVKKNEPFLMDE